MSRPRRNLALIVVLAPAVLVAGAKLPLEVSFALSVVGMLGLGFVAWLGRRFFTGRTLLKQGRWDDAALEFAGFEQELTLVAWRARLAFLYVGIYSSDGVAVARSTLGAIRLEQGQLDEARRHCERALTLDPLYAVPVANLALIAAREGRAEEAATLAQRAHALGFRRSGFAAALREAQAISAR
jgi:tetratricopeptide (TPR) repeat protein